MAHGDGPAGSSPESDLGLEDTLLDELVRLAFGWTVQVFAGAPQPEVAGLTLAQEVVATTVYNAWVQYRPTYEPTRYRGQPCPFHHWLRILVAWEAWRTLRRRRRLQHDQDPQTAG